MVHKSQKQRFRKHLKLPYRRYKMKIHKSLIHSFQFPLQQVNHLNLTRHGARERSSEKFNPFILVPSQMFESVTTITEMARSKIAMNSFSTIQTEKSGTVSKSVFRSMIELRSQVEYAKVPKTVATCRSCLLKTIYPSIPERGRSTESVVPTAFNDFSNGLHFWISGTFSKTDKSKNNL